MKKSLWALFALTGLCLGSCNKDDEDLFQGKDNYIVSFSLTKGEKTLYAAIADNEIVMSVASGYSLDGATAEIVMSENAEILPDPATITDWDNDQIFVVTAHNGQRKEYTYSVSEEGGTSKGSVILTTQAEVDAFGASGITSIDGSLIIGTASGRESITSLTALNKLEKVAYNVVVKQTYSGEKLDGLTNLETVGGGLRIETSGMKEAAFPSLRSVMQIDLVSETLENFACPAMTEIYGTFNSTASKLILLDLSALESIDGSLNLNSPTATLEQLSFPALQRIGGDFSANVVLQELDMASLETCGSISITSASLTGVSLPSLIECGGNFTIASEALKSLDLSALTTVPGNLNTGAFSDMGQEGGFGKFQGLISVGGTFTVGYTIQTNLPELVLPPNLKTCNALVIDDCSTLKTLDISGIDIKELTLSRASLLDLTIKGDRIFDGTLKILADRESRKMGSTYEYKFPKLEGIEEIGNLEIQSGIMPQISIAGIAKINGNLSLNFNDGYDSRTNHISVQDLKEITGNVTLGVPGTQISEVSFASVEKVGGSIDFARDSQFNCESLSFDLLTQAKDVRIWVSSATSEISMPRLTTIDQSLEIVYKKNSWDAENTMTDLDGFSTLQNVGSVRIENMNGLTSFAGLKNCVEGLSDEQWMVSGTGFIPTLEQMKSGEYLKENNE